MLQHLVIGSVKQILRRLGLEVHRTQYRNSPIDWQCVDWQSTVNNAPVQMCQNRMRHFFDNRTQGNGIWKWTHYFDIYDRHFNKFRGQEVHILEIGIYSGGSLEMWRDYFGPKAILYGVDIEAACRAYESDNVKIFIGDQADRMFWHEFRQKVPVLDIVIDDGGHQPQQQIVTLEELLPFLRSGGVYCCEDIHGKSNEFAAYIYNLGAKLNEMSSFREDFDDNERKSYVTARHFRLRWVQFIFILLYV